MLEEPPANSTRAKTGTGNASKKAKKSLSRRPARVSAEDDDVNAGRMVNASDAAKLKKAKVTGGEARVKPSKTDGHPVKIVKTHPGGDSVEVEPEELAKRKKRKTLKAEANDGLSTEPARTEAKHERPIKQNKLVSAASAKGASKAASTVGPARSRGNPSKVKKTQKAEHVTRERAPNDSTQMSALARRTSTMSNASSNSSGNGAKVAEVPPEMAMDNSVFSALLARDKGTGLIEKFRVPENAKSSKAAGKLANEQPNIEQTKKDNSKTDKKTKARPKKTAMATVSGSNGKKRKEAAGIDDLPEVLDVPDPLSDQSSAKKKQKKSQADTFDAVGSLLGSSVDSAKKKAKALMDFAGEVIGSGQKSIMSDVTGVAEGAVDEKIMEELAASPRRGPPADDWENEEASDEGPDETDLLKGFESSGDERDGEDVGFDEARDVPAIGKAKIKKVKAAQRSTAHGPGFVYIGRVPHGFYEHQMRAYFGQFGNITRLRLSRNKSTGHSKHYGFIEFESEEVARIVAQTMDNYLLFGHILKVKLIAKEQLHPDTFKGANKRFKQVPWAQIEGRKLAMPAGREQWEKRVETEGQRRKKKAEQMREIGYEFDSSLKGVDQVPIQQSIKAIEAAPSEEEHTLITGGDDKGGMIVISEVTKKPKKLKAKVEEAECRKDTEASTVSKGKRKAEDGLEKAQDMVEDATGPIAKRAKKAKKATDTVTNGTAAKVKNVKTNAGEPCNQAEDSIPSTAGPTGAKAKKHNTKTEKANLASKKAPKATAAATGKLRKGKD